MKGKAYVVILTAILSGIFFFFGLNAASWLWTGNPVSTSFFFVFPALGVITGLIYWSVNESRFEDFLAEKKLRATRR